MTEFFLEVAIVFLGVLLCIVTGLMAYISRAIVDASRKISVLEHAMAGIEKILGSISSDLRVTSKHDAQIAVIESEQRNLRAEMNLVHERFSHRQGQ